MSSIYAETIEIDDSQEKTEASCPAAERNAVKPETATKAVETKASSGESAAHASAAWANGLAVLVVPLGSATATRRTIWEQQIKANGGVCTSAISDVRFTHVAVAEEVTLDRLQAWAVSRRWKLPSTAGTTGDSQAVAGHRAEVDYYVTTAWLVESLTWRKRERELSFRWPPASTTSQSEPPANSQTAASTSRSAVPAAAFPIGNCPAAVQRTEEKPLTTSVPSIAKALAAGLAVHKNSVENGASEKQPRNKRVPDEAFGGALTLRQDRLVAKRAKFACQREPKAASELNTGLVATFGKLQQYYEKLGDQWRSRGYRLAMNVIQGLQYEVASERDLSRPELQRLGKKTREKIAEFVRTGSIARAECAAKDEMANALDELQDIWGVGLTTARQWYAQGCRNVRDVRRRVSELGLSSDQQIGLRCFEEFRERMPRSEAEAIVGVVRQAAMRLFGPRLRLVACGSYRRGAPTCGDVDILVTCESCGNDGLSDSQDIGSETEILSAIVEELRGFLTDDLKGAKFHSKEDREHTNTMYFGVCQLGPGHLHRRIDLKCYPLAQWPFALLSFTGSGPFNRSMRLYARRAGFSLSDHDIRPANHSRGVGRGERIWTGRPIEGVNFAEESDIFDFLGLEYREPHTREVDASWLAETATRESELKETATTIRSLQARPSDTCTEELAPTDLDEDSCEEVAAAASSTAANDAHRSFGVEVIDLE